MTVIYGRCAWLRAALRPLSGSAGRNIEVSVIDGPNCLPPDGWLNWGPWLLDQPDPFLASLIANSEELASVVKNLKGVRADLRLIPSGARQTNFTAFFESLLRRPWLLAIDHDFRGYDCTSTDEEPPSFCDTWVLRVTPVLVAYLDELVEMSERIVLHEEAEYKRVWGPLDDAFESVESFEGANPRKVGRPSLRSKEEGRAIVDRIVQLKAGGKPWKEVTECVNQEFLRKFTADAVEKTYSREMNRRAKNTD